MVIFIITYTTTKTNDDFALYSGTSTYERLRRRRSLIAKTGVFLINNARVKNEMCTNRNVVQDKFAVRSWGMFCRRNGDANHYRRHFSFRSFTAPILALVSHIKLYIVIHLSVPEQELLVIYKIYESSVTY